MRRRVCKSCNSAVALLTAAALAATNVLLGWTGNAMEVRAEESALRAYQVDSSTMVWSQADKKDTDWTDGEYGQYYLRTTGDDSDTRIIYLKWDISDIHLDKGEKAGVRLSHNAGTPGKTSVIGVYPALEPAGDVTGNEIRAVSGNAAGAVPENTTGIMTWDNRHEWDSSNKVAEFNLCADNIPSGGMETVTFDITDYINKLQAEGTQTLYLALRSETVDGGLYQSVRSARAANPAQTRPALVITKAQPEGPGVKPGEVKSQELQADASTMAWSATGKETTNWRDGEYGQLYLSSKPGDTDTRLIYLCWDLDGVVIPEDAQIKIRLHHNAGSKNEVSVVNIYPVTEEWTTAGPDALTWENRAAYDEGTLAGSFELRASDIPDGGMLAVEADVGKYVRDLLSRNITTLNVVLKLAEESENWQSLRSARDANPISTRPALLIEVDDKAPVYDRAEIGQDYKTVSLIFDEPLLACNPATLKAAVTLAADGALFQELGGKDQVKLEENRLVISLEHALSGEENRIKVESGALMDLKGNVLNSDIVTAMLSGEADTNAPQLRSAYITGMADQIVLNFNKLIAWNGDGNRSDVQLSVNGGTDYHPLPENSAAVIDGKSLRITMPYLLTEGSVCIKIGKDTIASLNGSIPISKELVSPVIQTVSAMKGERIIKAADDAYVDSTAPDTNYGYSTELYTRETESQKQRTFIKFDISDLGTFNTAKLKIMINDASQTGGTVRYFRVEDDSWNEKDITFSNQPEIQEQFSQYTIGNNVTSTWMTIDISEYLSEEKGRDGVLSLMLMDDPVSSRFTRKYSSKDITISSSYPQLVVGYDEKCPQIATTLVSSLNQKIEVVFDEDVFNNQPDQESLLRKVELSTDGIHYFPVGEGSRAETSGQKLTILLGERLNASQVTVKFLPEAVKDVYGNYNHEELVSRTMALDGAAPVLDKKASLDGSGHQITVSASEPVLNNRGNAEELKKAVSWSEDGVNFRPLSEDETVRLAGNTLVAVLSGKVAGSGNVLKIAAGAIRDEAGNVVDEEYRSDPISEDRAAPKLEASYFAGFNRELVLAFDEPLFAPDGVEALHSMIQISRDGSSFEAIPEQYRISIGVQYLHISSEDGWPLGSYRIRMAEGCLEDMNHNVIAFVETEPFSAVQVEYPYSHPAEADLVHARNSVKGIRFGNRDNAAGDANETIAAKGFSVLAQAIAAGNREEEVVTGFVDAMRGMLTDTGKMPNLSSGLDDRSQSPVVYGLALVWHQEDVMARFTDEERSKLVTFMKAALIAQLKGLNNRQYQNGSLTDIGTVRRPAMNGDGNNGVTGNLGEPHVTSLLASSLALGLNEVKAFIAEYDHLTFIKELEDQGLSTIAASFKNTNNFSSAATPEARLQEKGKIVNMVVKDPEWNFFGVTLDEYLEDPLKFFEIYDAHLYPHIAQDGDYMGQPGMEMEFRSADSGGPRESASYVVLGLEPSVANYVLLKYYGYADAPQDVQSRDNIEHLHKVAVSDWYHKVVNGYYSQCWIETDTQSLKGFIWEFLAELFFSTGIIQPVTFHDTFHYGNKQEMLEGGWEASGSWEIVRDTVIPYNYKTYVNDGVVGGLPSDPEEQVLRAGGNGTTVLYQKGASYAGINYTAWITAPDNEDGEAGLLLRVQDEKNYYKVSFSKEKTGIYRMKDGIMTVIAQKDYKLPDTARDYIFSSTPAWGWNEIIVEKTAHRLRAEMTGDRIDVYLNGEKILSGQDDTFDTGYVGLIAENSQVSFDALMAVRTTPGVTRLNEVAVGNGELTLRFDPVEGTGKYVVYYGTDPQNLNETWETYVTAPTVSGLENGKLYYFAVACETSQGTGGLSNVMSGTPYAPDAVTPTDIKTAVYGSTLRLFFQGDEINTEYLLKYGRTPGNYTDSVSGIAGSGAKVTLPPVASPYYMVLVPANEKGMGAQSEEFVVEMDSEYLHVVKVKSSHTPDGNYGPENTIDDNLNAESRWSVESKVGEGQVWIDYELSEPQKVNSISLAYSSGDIRKSYFDILISGDGIHYTPVLTDMETSGATAGLENYMFDSPREAKYVRVNCNGNSVSGKGKGWNSIIEMRIFGDVKWSKLNEAVETAKGILKDEKLTQGSRLRVEASMEAAKKLAPSASQKEVNEALTLLMDALYEREKEPEKEPDPDDGSQENPDPDDGSQENPGPDDGSQENPGPDDGSQENPDPDDGSQENPGPDDGSQENQDPDNGNEETLGSGNGNMDPTESNPDQNGNNSQKKSPITGQEESVDDAEGNQAIWVGFASAAVVCGIAVILMIKRKRNKQN